MKIDPRLNRIVAAQSYPLVIATIRGAPQWLAVVLLVGMTATIEGRCAAATGGLSAAARADFEWFSTLGFPDAKDCPYVVVATGEWSQAGNEPPQNRFVKGFLLATNASSFRVLTPDLFERTYFTTNVTAAPHARVGFELLDLSQEAATLLQKLKTPPTQDEFRPRFTERLGEQAEVFALAWACGRNGLEAAAQELYEAAQKTPSGRGQQSTPASFRESLEQALGHAMMWRAVVNFGDPSISRRQLLGQFEAIITNYPHSQHLPRATDTAALLKRMIAEDVAHDSSGRTNLLQMSVEQQVTELIFRLRDQNGQQYSQPGWCDIFSDWQNTTNTPAHRLVALGYAAVPQLIAAIDDPRFSRSVGYHRNFYFSHTVLTVGDCAQAILQRISGQSFYRPSSTSGYMSKDGQVSAARKMAEAWWANFQKKGEKQMLVDGIVAAGQDAPALARMLVERYPEIAAATLIRGVEAGTNSWVRTCLIDQVALLTAPSVTNFLYREIQSGPTLQTRVAAAYGLREFDSQAAVGAMIREWRSLGEVRSDDQRMVEELAEFLASSDSVTAIEALGQDWRRLPVGLRLRVVESVGQPNSPFHRKSLPTSVATWNAAENFLAGALLDQEAVMGLSGSRNGTSYMDPRVCDMAAWLLARKWAERYHFDLDAAFPKRERQRIECLNVWRQAHNLPALPVPLRPTTRVAPEQANWVTRIEWLENSAPARDGFLAGFTNQPLTVEAITALFTRFVTQNDPGFEGLEFMAIKDDDLTGVLLLVRLLPGSPPAEGQHWNNNRRVKLGTKDVYNSSGSAARGFCGNPEYWNDIGAAMAKALAAKPETPFEISIRLSAGK